MWEFIDELDKDLQKVRDKNLRDIEKALSDEKVRVEEEKYSMEDMDKALNKAKEAIEEFKEQKEEQVTQEDNELNVVINKDEVIEYLNAIDDYLIELSFCSLGDMMSDGFYGDWEWEDEPNGILASAYSTPYDELIVLVLFDAKYNMLWAEIRDSNDTKLEHLPKVIVFINEDTEIDTNKTFNGVDFLECVRSFVDETEKHIENPEDYL